MEPSSGEPQSSRSPKPPAVVRSNTDGKLRIAPQQPKTPTSKGDSDVARLRSLSGIAQGANTKPGEDFLRTTPAPRKLQNESEKDARGRKRGSADNFESDSIGESMSRQMRSVISLVPKELLRYYDLHKEQKGYVKDEILAAVLFVDVSGYTKLAESLAREVCLALPCLALPCLALPCLARIIAPSHHARRARLY